MFRYGVSQPAHFVQPINASDWIIVLHKPIRSDWSTQYLKSLLKIISVSGLTGNIKLQSGARSSLELDLMMFNADTGLVAK